MNKEQFLFFNKALPTKKPRLIRGPTGIGKSAFVKEFAESKNKSLITLNLSLYEAPDLIGLPRIENNKTVYAAPWWWPENGNVVLLLEELDLANESLQAPAMLLALDRVVGQEKLPDDVEVFATGNGGRYLRNRLDQALIRRFAVVDYYPTVSEWLDWAQKQKNFSSLVIDYITEMPEALDTPNELIGKANIQIPCRSTWSDLAEFLFGLTDKEQESVDIWAEAFIGKQSADAFAMWIKNRKKTLFTEMIFNGKAKAGEWSPIQVAHAATTVADALLKRSKSEQENALKFYVGNGSEQFAGLFARLPKEAASIVGSVKESASMAEKLVEITFGT